MPNIKQPKMIECCKNKKLIRYTNDFEILLLGSTSTNGYHKEYYSYSLFVELQKEHKLTAIVYHDQRSAYERKYFEYKKKQITFEKNTKKFVWTENDDWHNQQEFASRDEAIKEILELDKN